MGIDYNAILIYGWTFDYQQFCDMIKQAMGEERYEEFFREHDLYDFFVSQFVDELEKFKWGDASPYYDSDYADRIYYISFEFKNTNELYELMKHHKENNLHEYDILKIFNITDLPEVLALPDIK